jgi:hypothetical protein
MNAGDGPQDNKRAAPRHRTLKGGLIVLPGKMSTFQCTIRNVSDTGAMIEMASTLGVPQRFTLRMDDGGPDHEVTVSWRSDRRLGVHFET